MDDQRERLVAEIITKLNQARDKEPKAKGKPLSIITSNLNLAVLFGMILGITATVTLLETPQSSKKQNPYNKTSQEAPQQRGFDFYQPVNDLPRIDNEKDLPPLPPHFEEYKRLKKT